MRRFLPLLVFVLLPLVLLWRPLFGGEALFWGTPLLQFVPWQRLAAAMWRSGHLPLWNPLVGCGAPLAANYQTGAFYPLYALALVLPAEVALDWSVALHLAMAGLGMVAWARSAGLERFPALLTGLAVAGSGFLVTRAGLFPSIVATFAWLPIGLWRTERLLQSGRLRDSLWLGAALGLGLLAGHAQTAFYGLALVGGYAAWRVLRGACCVARIADRQSPLANRRSPLADLQTCNLPLYLLLALLVGFCLAAVQLLPTAELLSLSPRAGGVERVAGLTYSFWPWRLLTLFAPDLFGSPAHGDYWGYATYWEDAAYIGLIPLLLALEALAGLRRRSAWRGDTGFWLAVVGVSLFLALGRNNPLFLWLFDHAPGFDWFQSPARWLALTTIGLAALAGIGAQQWRRGRADRRRGGLGVAVGLAAVLGGLVAPRLLPAIPATFAPATVRLGLALAAAGGLVLLRRDAPWWRAAVVGFVLLDLLAFGWGLVPSVDRALYAGPSATGAALAAEPAPVRTYWPADGQPEPGYALKFGRYFRFDTFGPRDLTFWRSLRETLLPNVGMLDGIASANNFEPLQVRWSADLVRAADADPRLLPLLGVTHVISATADAQVAVTPLADSPGRAWLVSPSSPCPRVSASPCPPVPASPRLPISLHDTPNHVTIHLTADRPGYLVLADTWYPGWQATVDGRPAPILRVYTAFRAVPVGAGEHTVEMAYRPGSVRVGAVLSVAALAVLAVGLLWTSRESVSRLSGFSGYDR